MFAALHTTTNGDLITMAAAGFLLGVAVGMWIMHWALGGDRHDKPGDGGDRRTGRP